MNPERYRIASGVGQLDQLLGGLFVGDNVVWHDDAGSLASVFCLNFIQASRLHNEPLVYVSFDRSPKNLLDKLGDLAENPLFTILDCFTYGKGAGSEIFLRFYERDESEFPFQILCVKEPGRMDRVMEALYGVHGKYQGVVRFVFESLTGMQELWKGEEHILDFYSHSCPRLYELNTVAYWIIEKKAHSPRLKAQINQIAQVAIDLSIKRGKTSLTVLKAEGRDLSTISKPFHYWSRNLVVNFDSERHVTGRIDLGMRLKELRTRMGISQTELAKQVGVTPSTISQIESNLIHPSLPALYKMAEILAVSVGSFFQEPQESLRQVVFPASEAVDIQIPDHPKESSFVKLLIPLDFEPRAEPYLIEISPKKNLPSHFFTHKGEELGYVLSGKLQLKLEKGTHTAKAGDVIYLASEMPAQWKNPGPAPARMLWIKIKQTHKGEG